MDRITAAEVFVTIVDRGSMIAAANALDMSRSMVTRYLSQMESWADARLLHRSTRSLSLTPAGEQTLQHCRQLLELAAEVPSVGLLDDKAPSGMVRVSCAQAEAQGLLGPFFQQFLQRYPATSVDLHVSNDTVDMVEERIDLAIRMTNALDPNLIARPLGTCRSVLCASPDYIAQFGEPVCPEELRRHNCLTYAYFSSIWQFSRDGAPLSVPVKGNFSANESMVLLNATLAGAGVSLLPLHAVAPLIRSGQLVSLLPDCDADTLGIYGVYRSRKHMSPALRVLLDELVEYFEEIEM